jgi:alpha-1,3-rhamnosyl/mannosyltransferase
VAEAELRAIFQGARALVFPSLFEGFGMPVVEAFASGVPVLTSSVSALPEIAGDAAIQVDPRDTEAIREAMLRLADDSALCARLVAAGLLRARQFSWQTCAERVEAVYRNVARL